MAVTVWYKHRINWWNNIYSDHWCRWIGRRGDREADRDDTGSSDSWLGVEIGPEGAVGTASSPAQAVDTAGRDGRRGGAVPTTAGTALASRGLGGTSHPAGTATERRRHGRGRQSRGDLVTPRGPGVLPGHALSGVGVAGRAFVPRHHPVLRDHRTRQRDDLHRDGHRAQRSGMVCALGPEQRGHPVAPATTHHRHHRHAQWRQHRCHG